MYWNFSNTSLPNEIFKIWKEETFGYNFSKFKRKRYWKKENESDFLKEWNLQKDILKFLNTPLREQDFQNLKMRNEETFYNFSKFERKKY